MLNMFKLKTPKKLKPNITTIIPVIKSTTVL